MSKRILLICFTFLLGILLIGCGAKTVENHKTQASQEEKSDFVTVLKDTSNTMSFAENLVEIPADYVYSQQPDTTYRDYEIVATTWSSSNPKYVEVDSETGDITALPEGRGHEVTISVNHLLKDGSEVFGSYKVKVQEILKEIQLNANTTSLAVGRGVKLKAVGKPSVLSSSEIKWSSSNNDYAIVTAKGIVKAKEAGKGKGVTITAKATDGSNVSASLDFKILDPNAPMIALTFDDGPNYASTKIVVDTLKKYNAKATFFVLGQHLTKEQTNNRDILKEAYENGNEIASHTYDHKALTKLSNAEIKDETTKTATLIQDVIGEEPTLLRPPYGDMNSSVAQIIGYPMIMWSVDTLDWKTRNTQLTVDSVIKGARDGAVILMHDIHMPTAQAVEIIVPKLIEQGYQLVTISELAAAKGVTLEKGQRYSSMHNNN